MLKGNKLYLQDLGSTNGTYINKFRLSRPGDTQGGIQNALVNSNYYFKESLAKQEKSSLEILCNLEAWSPKYNPSLPPSPLPIRMGDSGRKGGISLKCECSLLSLISDVFHVRCRNSVLFTPAASQEDITVISEDSDDNNDNSDNGEDQEVSKDKEVM